MDQYREQHKRRLSFMPWLYYQLKDKHLTWAKPWQQEVQSHLLMLETVAIGDNCFIAPEANLFAEPGRPITIGDQSQIAADCFLHGPISLGNHVSINHNASLDGGSAGIHIGNNTRIAARVCIYAFNHGMAPEQLVRDQSVTSEGVHIGDDVWIGANVSIVDGVTIGNGAVIGMGSVVTGNVEANTKVAGIPAKPIGSRTRMRSLSGSSLGNGLSHP